MPEYVLLDTDVFSYMYDKRPGFEPFRPLLEGKILALSFITQGELFYGAYKNGWGQRRLTELQDVLRSFLLLPYSPTMPIQYGRLVADCRAQGNQIALHDAWIAATALSQAIPLATNNIRHFRPIAGLSLLHPSPDFEF